MFQGLWYCDMYAYHLLYPQKKNKFPQKLKKMTIFPEKNIKIDIFYFELSDKSMDLYYMAGEYQRFINILVFYNILAF